MYTDHAAIKWIMETENLTGRLHRWSLILRAYAGKLKICHLAGSLNTACDTLSRLVEPGRIEEIGEDEEEGSQERPPPPPPSGKEPHAGPPAAHAPAARDSRRLQGVQEALAKAEATTA